MGLCVPYVDQRFNSVYSVENLCVFVQITPADMHLMKFGVLIVSVDTRKQVLSTPSRKGYSVPEHQVVNLMLVFYTAYLEAGIEYQ